ncbi:MAG: peptidoglycan-binding protein [Deltaproteobacteria bacterium]|nr:peptidoglycan-binding protein [Deltaproteobacteria bacterium]
MNNMISDPGGAAPRGRMTGRADATDAATSSTAPPESPTAGPASAASTDAAEVNPSVTHALLAVADPAAVDPGPLTSTPTLGVGAVALRIRPSLQRGSRGEKLAELTRLLNGHGYRFAAEKTFAARTNAAVRAFQLDHGLPDDGRVGPSTWAALERPASDYKTYNVGRVSEHRAGVVLRPAALDVAGLLAATAAAESGRHGYAAINPNDNGSGLSFGRFQFNQGQGSLGVLFKRMYEADPTTFAGILYPAAVKRAKGRKGKTPSADELARQLLRELNDPKQRLSGPIALHLGERAFRKPLQALGAVEAFCRAQEGLARELYFDAAAEIAREHGLRSERALALLFDMCIQHGAGGTHAVVEYVLRTDQAKSRALRRATDATRPQVEHDVLVRLAQQTETMVSEPLVKRALVRRRRAILTARDLSDMPAMATDPAAPASGPTTT